jgi:hypothetical protein
MQIAKYTGPHRSYAEVPQTNKLRWVCLYRAADGTFSEQSLEFKCKDFFNEIVAKYNGHLLGCYGFTADSIQTNDEGVWVELRNIDNQEAYQQNIGSINKLIAAEGLPVVELLPYKKGFVCLLPRKFFDNTYLVSFLTYLMRVANVAEVVQDPTWREHPTKAIDCPFVSLFDVVMARGFKTPETKAKAYYYAGQAHNHAPKPAVHLVHNNGVLSWNSLLKAEGKL